MTTALDLHPEVAAALAEGRAVVALESSVIGQGLPQPDNLQVARHCAAAVRSQGAVPATVAVIDGRLCIGLTDEQLARIAARKGVVKVSGRDLGLVLARKQLGATTVAATLIAARLAGIRVFATGGIGGVHPGAGLDFDVSADLMELGRSPVAVVSAGAKSILDLAATLEVLETQGVPVIGLATDCFPAFYQRESDLALTASVPDPETAAAVMAAHWGLGLDSGMIFANPIPEDDAIPADRLATWLAEAQAQAVAQEVTGKALTPFLLARLAEISGGETLAANKALLVHNARQAGHIATAYAAQRGKPA